MPLRCPRCPDSAPARVTRPAGRTVVDVIDGEHRRLAELCAELTDATVPVDRRRTVAEVVTATLSRHLSAEEQYLYPAVRAAVPDGDLLADREVAEDHAILVTLRQLAGTGGDDTEFGRLAAAVAVQVHRHAGSAAEELLPLLAQMATTEELIRLGNRVETAEEAAPTRPHPGTPATPAVEQGGRSGGRRGGQGAGRGEPAGDVPAGPLSVRNGCCCNEGRLYRLRP